MHVTVIPTSVNQLLYPCLAMQEQDDVNNGRMSPILATDTVSDEFSGLKLTSDENSKEKKA